MSYKSLGEILREKRKAKGWSQGLLAKKANTSASSISGYEIGRSIPNLYIACDIAKALGCEVEELIEKTSKARLLTERLTTFFASDDYLKYNEADAEYINEQINRIAEDVK